MHTDLSSFAARLRGRIQQNHPFEDFDAVALELFRLQYDHNTTYRKICQSRGLTPSSVKDWTEVPAIPTSAFKELDLTSLDPEERVAVFHSSGTTEQKPSRHYHNAESLNVYEASLWSGFQRCFPKPKSLLILTPTAVMAPRSSLIHMFETVRRRFGQPGDVFAGGVMPDAGWSIDFDRVVQRMRAAIDRGEPLMALGTAFSFVHLLDYLAEKDLRFKLPGGSNVMETGGYKNRSRTMPKAELHGLITDRMGVPCENIVCEYGMSELSSQAYATDGRVFHFPPWARVRITSPETGLEVGEGETGLVRIFDLANVFSVASIQTEDLGIRRGDGFELVGRAQQAEPRGCSLMTA